MNAGWNDLTLRCVDVGRDALAITDIYNHYVRHTTVTFEEMPVTADMMASRIRDISESYPYIVAERADGEISGFCYAHSWKAYSAYRGTLETTVYVRPEMTSSGIGRCMMSRLVEMCRDKGFHSLIACITAENKGSLRFHKSIGFVAVSDFREVGYKFGRYLDVVDMQLLL